MRSSALAASLVLLVSASGPVLAQDKAPKEKTPADVIIEKLDAAKAEYAKALDENHKKLVAAVETRLNAAKDNGDLTAVEALTVAKNALETEGKFPDGITDTAMKLAKATADRAAVTAREALIAAYQIAVKELTKAGLISEAKVIQTELEEFKSGATKDPNVIDLLKLIDPDKTAQGGAWVKNGSHAFGIPGRSGLSIPYVPPAEYDLTLRVLRVKGNDTFSIGLIAGDTRCEVELDGYAKYISGINFVDGKFSGDNVTTYSGMVFSAGKYHTIVCSVRKDSIAVSRDGHKVINFNGDMNRISDGVRYKSGDYPKDRLFIALSNDPFVISRIELKAISGKGKAVKP